MKFCQQHQTAPLWSACCVTALARLFAMERLKQRGSVLLYRCGKGHAGPLQCDKYSGELVLTPLKLINRIAQLVPPPRTHRHRYYGVLAPNSPLRAAVTAKSAGGCGGNAKSCRHCEPAVPARYRTRTMNKVPVTAIAASLRSNDGQRGNP